MTSSVENSPVGDDELVFAAEEPAGENPSAGLWKVMIVDDDPEVHNVTQLALRDFNFENKRLALIDAYSGEEAKRLLQEHPDTALILLDVVMEQDDSGLEVVRFIRNQLANDTVRIVLRTGQPGQAPERAVIVDYDINDYKAKIELTTAKLFTTVVAALRTFRHVAAIETQRQELERIAAASARFVPREFLKILGKSSITDIALGDQVYHEMSILFADIRAFTTLSEERSPQQIIDFVNGFLGQFGPVIRQNKGFVVKYMGDALMAVFPDSADDALQAAITELRLLARQTAQSRITFNIGIGIHTGDTVLGTVGDGGRLQADLLSDAVNLASRLEGLTKEYGAPIVISEQTLQKLQYPEHWHSRFLGKVRVKGRRSNVLIYEVFDDTDKLKLETKTDFEEGLNLYYQNEFAEASVLFNGVIKNNPADKAARLYLERSARYMVQGDDADTD